MSDAAMKQDKALYIQQLEDALHRYQPLAGLQRPKGGWIRAVRQALGMTNRQLARRSGRRSAQSIHDLQQREAAETIQLNSLRELAEAMGCRLVYAIVPARPIEEMLRERATAIAHATLRRSGHSMRLEGQGLGVREEQRAVEGEIESLLEGSRKRLWD
jgi:predicted DNA-binding mobile mystery protein A